MFAKGEMVPHPTKEGLYALRYAGLQRKYEGSVSVEEGEGQYDAIAGMMAQKVYFEIPYIVFLSNNFYKPNFFFL